MNLSHWACQKSPDAPQKLWRCLKWSLEDLLNPIKVSSKVEFMKTENVKLWDRSQVTNWFNWLTNEIVSLAIIHYIHFTEQHISHRPNDTEKLIIMKSKTKLKNEIAKIQQKKKLLHSLWVRMYLNNELNIDCVLFKSKSTYQVMKFRRQMKAPNKQVKMTKPMYSDDIHRRFFSTGGTASVLTVASPSTENNFFLASATKFRRLGMTLPFSLFQGIFLTFVSII